MLVLFKTTLCDTYLSGKLITHFFGVLKMENSQYQILRKLQQNAQKRDTRKGNAMSDALLKAFDVEGKLDKDGTAKVSAK